MYQKKPVNKLKRSSKNQFFYFKKTKIFKIKDR